MESHLGEHALQMRLVEGPRLEISGVQRDGSALGVEELKGLLRLRVEPDGACGVFWFEPGEVLEWCGGGMRGWNVLTYQAV